MNTAALPWFGHASAVGRATFFTVVVVAGNVLVVVVVVAGNVLVVVVVVAGNVVVVFGIVVVVGILVVVEVVVEVLVVVDCTTHVAGTEGEVGAFAMAGETITSDPASTTHKVVAMPVEVAKRWRKRGFTLRTYLTLQSSSVQQRC
jgi:hypothetical protein